jgi:hypothetical protein
MIKIAISNFNVYTILSLILLFLGIIFYFYWGIRFGVWTDIGIYSITIFFVLCGILGIVLTLYEKTDTSQ